jgi:Zn-dependent protease with chaperone function
MVEVSHEQDSAASQGPGASGALPVMYYDGRSAQARAAQLRISGDEAQLHDATDGSLLRRFDWRQAEWPERQRHGQRLVVLPAEQDVLSGQLRARDAAAYDAWALMHLPRAESLIVRLQQSWRGVVVACVALMALCIGLYLYGLPLAARGITAIVPHEVDAELGRAAFAQIDGLIMKPSRLSADRQARLREKFQAATARAYPDVRTPVRLEFRKSEIGPNAFALPGGTMVMTDELVELVKDDEVILGVLGHELGHVMSRHGMRQLVQVTAIQTVASVAFGDYGGLLTAAPLILGGAAYSREHEREADEASIHFMRANGISPLVMVKFFEAVRAEQKTKTKKTPLGIAIISTHPSDEERMERFRQAAP